MPYPCTVRKCMQLAIQCKSTLYCRQAIGTGFIGYTKYKDKYITVLVTANRVIPDFEYGKASRIAFENLLPDNKKLLLKGFEIFTGGFWSSPLREVRMILIDSSTC